MWKTALYRIVALWCTPYLSRVGSTSWPIIAQLSPPVTLQRMREEEMGVWWIDLIYIRHHTITRFIAYFHHLFPFLFYFYHRLCPLPPTPYASTPRTQPRSPISSISHRCVMFRHGVWLTDSDVRCLRGAGLLNGRVFLSSFCFWVILILFNVYVYFSCAHTTNENIKA